MSSIVSSARCMQQAPSWRSLAACLFVSLCACIGFSASAVNALQQAARMQTKGYTSFSTVSDCRGFASTPHCQAVLRSFQQFQTDRVRIGAWRSRQKVVFVQFPQPFLAPPRVVVSPTSLDGENSTFAITIRQVHQTGFEANLFRLHETSWRQDLALVYAAWSENAKAPTGVRLGTARPLNFSRTSPTFSANYGGQHTTITVDLDEPFFEDAVVLATPRLESSIDRQAVFAVTSKDVRPGSIRLNLIRVDQSWEHEQVVVDYIMATTALTLVSDDSCPTCRKKPASRVLDFFVFPNGQFGSSQLSSFKQAHRFQTLDSSDFQSCYNISFKFKTTAIEPQPFQYATVPYIIATAYMPFQRDVLAVTIKSPSQFGFQACLSRVDRVSGWESPPKLFWLAWEQPLNDVMPLSSGNNLQLSPQNGVAYFTFRVDDYVDDAVIEVHSPESCAAPSIFVSTNSSHPSREIFGDVQWQFQSGGSWAEEGSVGAVLMPNSSSSVLYIFHNDANFRVGSYFGLIDSICSNVNVSLSIGRLSDKVDFEQRYNINFSWENPQVFRLPMDGRSGLLQIEATVDSVTSTANSSNSMPEPLSQYISIFAAQASADPLLALNISSLSSHIRGMPMPAISSTDTATEATRTWKLSGNSGYVWIIFSSPAISTNMTVKGSMLLTTQTGAVELPFGPPEIEFGAIGVTKSYDRTLARASVAHGNSLSLAVIGFPSTFMIRAKDRFGNLRTRGGDEFTVQLSGPISEEHKTYSADERQSVNASAVTGSDGTPIRIIDEGFGRYFVQYTPSFSGQYSLSIQLNGSHIFNSPFSLTVEPDFNVVQSGKNRTVHIPGQQYKYFSMMILDKIQDIAINVNSSKPVDVLLSTSNPTPTLDNSASFILKSDRMDSANPLSHKFRLKPGDPGHSVGNVFVGVFAVYGDTEVEVSSTTSIYARQISLERLFGGVISSLGPCSGGADCTLPAVCQAGICVDRPMYLLRLGNPAESLTFVVETAAGNCSGLSIEISDRAEVDNAVIASSSLDRGEQDFFVQMSSNVTPPHPVVGLYYARVSGQFNSSSNCAFRLHAFTGVGGSAIGSTGGYSNEEVRPLPQLRQAAVLPAPTMLSAGVPANTLVSPSGHSFFQFFVSSPGSQVTCNATLSDAGSLLISTVSAHPRADSISSYGWRADANAADSLLISIKPSDPQFRRGVFYASVYARYTVTSVQIACSLSSRSAPAVPLGHVIGGSLENGQSKQVQFLADSGHGRYSIKTFVSAGSTNTTVSYRDPPPSGQLLHWSQTMQGSQTEIILFSSNGTVKVHPVPGEVYFVTVQALNSSTEFSMVVDGN